MQMVLVSADHALEGIECRGSLRFMALSRSMEVASTLHISRLSWPISAPAALRSRRSMTLDSSGALAAGSVAIPHPVTDHRHECTHSAKGADFPCQSMASAQIDGFGESAKSPLRNHENL